jgi:transcriptional regulator of heat shock response
VLGPRRMHYPRMRALVEGVAQCVTGLLTRWERP